MVAETLLVGYCPTLEAGKHLMKKKKKKKKKKTSGRFEESGCK